VTDDTNKVFSKVTGSDKVTPDPELMRVLQDSYDVSLKVIEARTKMLLETLGPLVEQLKKAQEEQEKHASK